MCADALHSGQDFQQFCGAGIILAEQELYSSRILQLQVVSDTGSVLHRLGKYVQQDTTLKSASGRDDR